MNDSLPTRRALVVYGIGALLMMGGSLSFLWLSFSTTLGLILLGGACCLVARLRGPSLPWQARLLSVAGYVLMLLVGLVVGEESFRSWRPHPMGCALAWGATVDAYCYYAAYIAGSRKAS